MNLLITHSRSQLHYLHTLPTHTHTHTHQALTVDLEQALGEFRGMLVAMADSIERRQTDEPGVRGVGGWEDGRGGGCGRRGVRHCVVPTLALLFATADQDAPLDDDVNAIFRAVEDVRTLAAQQVRGRRMAVSCGREIPTPPCLFAVCGDRSWPLPMVASRCQTVQFPPFPTDRDAKLCNFPGFPLTPFLFHSPSLPLSLSG